MWVKCSHCKYGGNGDNQCIAGRGIKRCKKDVGCSSASELLDKYKNDGCDYLRDCERTGY